MDSPVVPAASHAPIGLPGKGWVLVVDDEAALRSINARILQDAGYNVVEAANGKDALTAVAQHDFDAILTDLTMPEMTGMQLLRDVRKNGPDVPVLLITANPAVDTAAQAVELGALKYLIKPVGARELVAMIEQAVQQGRVARFKRRLVTAAGDTAKLMLDRAAMEGTLDRGLRRLWMAYQPIVNWRTREMFAHEALVRTDEPELPNPGLLLRLAERLGRILHVGRAVRARVGSDIREHGHRGNVFVNLHSADLSDAELYSPDGPLAPFAKQIVLEITEREALDPAVDVPAQVARLRKMGFRSAIDDLGAGFSGLDYFARLTPDVAKIDMSLVRDIDSESIKQKLVGSLVSLCKELDVLVVAEGIETAAERDTLALLGCNLFQGYLFARPGKPYPEVAW